MKILNTEKFLGYKGESYSRELKFEIEDELKDCDIYFEFEKKTSKKSYISNKIDINKKYMIPYEILDEVDFIEVQMVAYRGNNFVKKSPEKTFYVEDSINAVDVLLEDDGYRNLFVELKDTKADNISFENGKIQLMANGKKVGNQYVIDRALTMELDQSTGILKLIGVNENGEYKVLKEVDFDVEKILTSVYVDESTKELVMEFINYQTIKIPIGDVFNVDNYYNKEQTNNIIDEKTKSFLPLTGGDVSGDTSFTRAIFHPTKYVGNSYQLLSFKDSQSFISTDWREDKSMVGYRLLFGNQNLITKLSSYSRPEIYDRSGNLVAKMCYLEDLDLTDSQIEQLFEEVYS